MSDSVGGFLLGFGAVGLFYSVLFWASFKTLIASIVEQRRATQEATSVLVSMKSEARRKKDEADFWKPNYEDDDEKEEPWNS
ncbi:MAG: hypothetical protein P4L67_04745 [Candidatus Pacebacteria bacterium]|nr:hypothetical protein [Candidatus Paceibacterota bacterium]